MSKKRDSKAKINKDKRHMGKVQQKPSKDPREITQLVPPAMACDNSYESLSTSESHWKLRCLPEQKKELSISHIVCTV
jgi:hypothetical protein